MTIWYAILTLAIAAGVLIVLWRLINPPPRLEMGQRGILQRGHGWGWIPWDEIEGAYPPSAGEADAMRLRLRVTERLARILRRKRHLPRETSLEESVEIRLDLAGSGLSAVDLLREILSHEHVEAANRSKTGVGRLTRPG